MTRRKLNQNSSVEWNPMLAPSYIDLVIINICFMRSCRFGTLKMGARLTEMSRRKRQPLP